MKRASALLLLALAATVAGVAAVGGAYAHTGVGSTGQLSGKVEVCGLLDAKGVTKCSLAAATVTVRAALHGKPRGRIVATGNAPHGRFSFTLPPGRYLPEATHLHTKLNIGLCGTVEATVRKGHTTQDLVRCSARIRS